jgi:signal peptidase II
MIEGMMNEHSSARECADAVVTTSPVPRRAPRRTPGLRAWALLLGVALVVVLADQVSKRLIDSHLTLYESWPSESWPVHFIHAANSGAAFSILQNQTTFLIFSSVIGLGAILLFFFYPPLDHPLLRFALGLQLGGAIGNLIDRVAIGSVTDFIQFPHYPAFNVADSSIVIGVAILMWFLLFRQDRTERGVSQNRQ